MGRSPRLQWHWAKRQFGIWGVRDYYTLLEQMASEGAHISVGYLLMVIAASVVATAGLLMDSAAVVIGAMCVAPFLAPSRAVCLGGVFRDGRIFWGGLFKQAFGLLFVGTPVSYLITVVLYDLVPGVGLTHEVMLRSMPNTKDLVLTMIIAVGAGAAASLALAADPRVVPNTWGQIVDAMIGVEIAISLLPPASVIGIGLALGKPAVSMNAFWLLMVSIVGLNFVGSMLMLMLLGVRRRYVASEKAIRRTVRDTIVESMSGTPAEVTANVVLLGEDMADVRATIREPGGAALPDSLAEATTREIQKRTGFRTKVLVELLPCQVHSLLPCESDLRVQEQWYAVEHDHVCKAT